MKVDKSKLKGDNVSVIFEVDRLECGTDFQAYTRERKDFETNTCGKLKIKSWAQIDDILYVKAEHAGDLK